MKFSAEVCAHGRKPIACASCQTAGPPQELLHFISLVAEAKTHLLIASQGTAPGSPERSSALGRLRSCNERMRAHLDAIGGLDVLPSRLQVEVRICELGYEKLSAMESQGGQCR